MNKIMWWLPTFVHNLVLKLTGYRLVKVTSADFVEYVWSKYWPYAHPFDNRFPATREIKGNVTN